ncbi:MAG: DUF1266 domain-containing protein, partial [Oscillospiraceae bacterium]|nr:DUF1266 domain-containing protein [Oscillospiraceae bacterium]
FTVEELVDLPGPGLNIAYAHMVKSLLHPDDIPDAEKYRVHILNNMLGRINNGLYHFKTAKKVLQGLGYSANELEALDSTSAWDYGRCAFIARSCAYTRFLEEDEAWMYMKKAADNASCVYDSWRDFLAGYVAGRALGYGNDSTDIFAILRYLLQSAKSPYNEVPFKSAHP